MLRQQRKVSDLFRLEARIFCELKTSSLEEGLSEGEEDAGELLSPAFIDCSDLLDVPLRMFVQLIENAAA